MFELIPGNSFIDDRGVITTIEGFPFEKMKRFSQIKNHITGFIRAWTGYRDQDTYIFVPYGAIMIGMAPIQNMTVEETKAMVISHEFPRVLKIPAGFAFGYKTLVDNSIVHQYNTLADELDQVNFRFDIIDIWGFNFR